MIPFHLALAVVAITAPDFPTAEQPPCELWALQTVALSLELLDPRECRYFFQGPQYDPGDLRNVRERYTELREAPPLCDAVRFPSLDLCRDMREWNREYKAWLEKRADLFPGEEWIAEAMAECDQLYAVWDCAADLQTGYYYLYWKRRELKKLREIIGPQMYYAGCLPSPVPAWRFQRID